MESPGSMTESKPTARARIAPAGLLFLAITSVGWGFNWPVTKYLLGELPPLTLRGVTGVIGALLLAGLALVRGQGLAVAEGQWPRLVLAAVLNVTCWMVLMAFALPWLPASEATLIAYTMPVWASLLAWPVLGERPTVLRTLGLVMAFVGLASIMGGIWSPGRSSNFEVIRFPGPLSLALEGPAAVRGALGDVFSGSRGSRVAADLCDALCVISDIRVALHFRENGNHDLVGSVSFELSKLLVESRCGFF